MSSISIGSQENYLPYISESSNASSDIKKTTSSMSVSSRKDSVTSTSISSTAQSDEEKEPLTVVNSSDDLIRSKWFDLHPRYRPSATIEAQELRKKNYDPNKSIPLKRDDESFDFLTTKFSKEMYNKTVAKMDSLRALDFMKQQELANEPKPERIFFSSAKRLTQNSYSPKISENQNDKIEELGAYLWNDVSTLEEFNRVLDDSYIGIYPAGISQETSENQNDKIAKLSAHLLSNVTTLDEFTRIIKDIEDGKYDLT